MIEEPTIIGGEAATAERTQLAVAPGAEATQAAIVIECPVCHTTNPPGDRWCQDCGFLLTSPAPEVAAVPASSGPRLALDGRDFELRAGANSIGRVGADVLLPDPTVSRHHATLTVAEDGAWIEDAGSTNGTSLNGSPVTPGSRSRIRNGDTLKLGNVSVQFVWPDEAAGGLPEAGEGGGETAEAPAGEVAGTLVGADGAEIALRPGVTTIGRRAENMIVLSGDPYASGRHAEIRCDSPQAGAGGCVVVDIGSTNGTFLRRAGEEEERLRPHDPQPLSSGDVIRLGQTQFTFQAAPPVDVEEAGSVEGTESVEPASAGPAEAEDAAGEPAPESASAAE